MVSHSSVVFYTVQKQVIKIEFNANDVKSRRAINTTIKIVINITIIVIIIKSDQDRRMRKNRRGAYVEPR